MKKCFTRERRYNWQRQDFIWQGVQKPHYKNQKLKQQTIVILKGGIRVRRRERRQNRFFFNKKRLAGQSQRNSEDTKVKRALFFHRQKNPYILFCTDLTNVRLVVRQLFPGKTIPEIPLVCRIKSFLVPWKTLSIPHQKIVPKNNNFNKIEIHQYIWKFQKC